MRQWNRDWIQYDEFYRPIIFNPFRAPVRIAYALANATRILVIQPLERVVVDVAELAAYSFTAVVLGAANVVSDVANVAADVVNVAVGTFFGGGFVPGVGVPFVAPPPLLTYDNVPVQVRYSDATYEPFRVGQIVDVGDDVQYGGRKVLLDGATPAWGQWTTSPTGERQFEVHRTQQYPGLGEPQEAPLPGDYQMRLASDESADVDRTQMYLIAAAGRGRRAGLRRSRAGLLPRASAATAVMAPAGVLDNCPALQLIPRGHEHEQVSAHAHDLPCSPRVASDKLDSCPAAALRRQQWRSASHISARATWVVSRSTT